MKSSNAPRRIYLQHDPENTGEPFSEAHEVTWCADRINRNDIEYVRADVVKRKTKEEIMNAKPEVVFDPAAPSNTPRVDALIAETRAYNPLLILACEMEYEINLLKQQLIKANCVKL